MTITQQPSPDWNMVTLKWAATNLDGSPTTGTIDVIYNSLVPMLDDDPVTPVSIYPKLLRAPLTVTTIQIWEGDYDSNGAPVPGTGAFVPRDVGYLELKVPASNDPDITGAGGTYSFTENLNGVPGRRNVVFIADKDAPGGTIWLNKLPGGVDPEPAEPYSVVYWNEFLALRETVEAIEAPPVATTTDPGVVRRSTAAEVDAGDDVNAYVTPKRLDIRLAAKVSKADLADPQSEAGLLLSAAFAAQTGGVRAVTGPTLPPMPVGTKYVWNQTDSDTGALLDILTGTV